MANAQQLANLVAETYSCAKPVLDMETGEMLEYRQLLHHPQFAKAWNLSAANEFGWLAQGMGGRIKERDNIFHAQD